ncbi:MAG TPA: glycosyltransferase [Chitinophagaceae bacterium]|nr:glycosyltransferase [Chitinophagaceae bacterium]
MKKVVIIGPAHPLRGGLATFNQRLAREFSAQGMDCEVWSFSLQYPSFLFPGKTQYSDEPAPEGIRIRSVINSVNPLNWWITGRQLARLRPDLVVVRYWLPFMGPALGTLLRRVRRNGHTRILCIADNVIPHEKRPGDRAFTRYFLKSCDGFVTMSEKVMQDLRQFEKTKPARLVQHPLYDTFGDALPKQEARTHLGLPATGKILLFFGFIRAYKGLDLLLEAMADPRIQASGIRLIIAGEFYEDSAGYQQLIESLGIRERLILKTDFIADREVRYYLCAADAVIQPYRSATQSGVTPLAYNFERPMIVTNVGGLPALVPDGQAGVVVAPTPTALADGILRFYELGEDYFIPHLRTEKRKYSWTGLVHTLEELAASGGGGR